jgi:hypothetical protein
MIILLNFSRYGLSVLNICIIYQILKIIIYKAIFWNIFMNWQKIIFRKKIVWNYKMTNSRNLTII